MQQVPLQQNKYLTLILLCLGYFIDFYDLSIMGSGYSELIHDQFNITTTTQIQQTYLLISNFQTVGIFIGAVLFGMLGDKIGRAKAIRYSILLYSLATLLAVYTHSLPLFILLRVLAYIGLATEFSTSTVLIIELFPARFASWGSALLYSFGVLGGITATSLSFVSWELMFICGGLAGLILYMARGKIQESEEFLYTQQKMNVSKISITSLLTEPRYVRGLIRYLLMIMPYYAIITMMFIFPNYIIKHYTLGEATKILLIGFFIGNIISSLASAAFNNFFSNYKAFISCALVLFVILMTIFPLVSEKYLFWYAFGLGILGGGYPISWAQQVAREYPPQIRALASNVLFALGRASSIGFNVLIAWWLAAGSSTFISGSRISVIAVFILAFISVIFSANNYRKEQAIPGSLPVNN